jgi:HAD superfamily hydrolase (TIGR01509 family)
LAIDRRSAVIFDLDGTLTRPYLDFDAMRAEIGIAAGPILEAIDRMDADDRLRAEAILLKHEWEAAEHAALYEGAVQVVAACRTAGCPVAILTRNARPVVVSLLTRHGFVVDAIRTREDGAIKPAAEPVLSICSQLGADPRRSWMVGDYLFDIMSGQAAGTRTVLMIGDQPTPEYASRADYVIRRLPELLDILPLNQPQGAHR